MPVRRSEETQMKQENKLFISRHPRFPSQPPPPPCSPRFPRIGNLFQKTLTVVNLFLLSASQITPSSSSGYYAPSSSYALPAPVDFQFHVPSDCEQICTNTPGSYRCSCVSGYQLSSDGKSCVGELAW